MIRQTICTASSYMYFKGTFVVCLRQNIHMAFWSRAGPGLRIGQTYPLRDVRAG